jgi:hypothetical protein
MDNPAGTFRLPRNGPGRLQFPMRGAIPGARSFSMNLNASKLMQVSGLPHFLYANRSPLRSKMR